MKLNELWTRKTSLSLKLLIATWTISSFATLILTVGQLVWDYQRDFDKLQNNFSIIQDSYLASMAEQLWSYNTHVLKIQLDGLSRLQGISYLKLTADNKVLYENGKTDPSEDSHRSFEIRHKDPNQVLGTLDVELDTKNLQYHYVYEAFWIFIHQAVKTLIVVFCLYFIFNKIIVVHIQRIAEYLRTGLRENKNLVLHRPAHDEKDELDILVDSINRFRGDLLEANGRLEELNQALEQKVMERTSELTNKNQSLERAMFQIKSMQTAMAVQERLASLGRLTAGVAHEIRNPLNFVLNFSELMDESDEISETKELSKMVLKHSRRIDQIVRSMQILSGNSGDLLEETDVSELVKTAYQQVISHRSLSATGVSPKVTCHLEDPAMASVYPTSLLRACANIIDNAIYALERKALSQKNFEPELTISTVVFAEHVDIIIRDNGIGISPDIAEKIFDPFFTTKNPGEGAGLGLAVAFNIVQKHGGHLNYTSDEGHWTEFVMSIPLNHESTQA